MFGTAYFTDGHTEPITSYHTNPNCTELYFATNSGTYGYKEYITSDPCYTRNPFSSRCWNFYKYNNELNKWLVVINIEYIEIYTEVLPDGRF